MLKSGSKNNCTLYLFLSTNIPFGKKGVTKVNHRLFKYKNPTYIKKATVTKVSEEDKVEIENLINNK